MRIDYAERARALVGTRFRPQGRGAGGLDCVGLVLATFGLAGDRAPGNYRLRGHREADAKRCLEQSFRRVCKLAAGDVMLMQVAADQLHLAVRTNAGFVHAHAGIGRIVETPGMPEWPLLGIYRISSRSR
jgi:cell wall-associated NlpC family hydrolase